LTEPSEKGRKYKPVIEKLFLKKFKKGATEVNFTRTELQEVATAMGLSPKNLGDLIYSFRYRASLPQSIIDAAPKNHVWIIVGKGDAQYRMVAVSEDYAFIKPRAGKSLIDIPDATPGVITRYARKEEQALLAKVRYNRLIDIFLGITCYSLQNHLRTKIASVGQVETDELYIGIDDDGRHYSVPVQAKGGSDKHSIVQIEQDFELCTTVEPFSQTECIPVAAQFLSEDTIAMFSFKRGRDGLARIDDEKHYRLVPEAPKQPSGPRARTGK
jgi:hypothetical protein